MNFSELRLKTGLLGFSPRDLNGIFDDLEGQAEEVLAGHLPVPDRVAEITAVWWDEVTTAVNNAIAEAQEHHAANPEYVCHLQRYARHALLPRERGAQASSIQAWDYHLGLILKGLEASNIGYEIQTVQE